MTNSEKPEPFMRCTVCKKLTTVLEAEMRKFNPRKCACGGELLAVDGSKKPEPWETAADESVDKVRCLVGYLEAFVDGKYGKVYDHDTVRDVIKEANEWLAAQESAKAQGREGGE